MTRFLLAILTLCVPATVAWSAITPSGPCKPDDEGFIRCWVILDPIKLPERAAKHEENAQREFFDKEFFPGQRLATPKDGDKVFIEGKECTWHARQSSDYTMSFEDLATDVARSLFLGVVYITCERDIPNVRLSIGSDDGSLWILNGQEVIRVYEARSIDRDQNSSPMLTLKKGLNILRLAVINGDGPSAACTRFIDKNGAPVRSYTIHPTPPAR
ncbi:MAG: acetylxylan esterase [Bacillota bacterium]